MAEEIWKEIPSKPGYSASNLGRIRSDKRMTPYTRRNMKGKISYYPKKEKILTQTEDNGYLKTHLGWSHRLVAETFLGPCPEGCTEINHINQIRSDNRVENLEYCDHSYNVTYLDSVEKRNRSRKKTLLLKKLKSINADIVWQKVSELVNLFS